MVTMLDERTIIHKDSDIARPTASRPLSLSDDQMTAVMNAAAPLLPGDRSQFLLEVAQALQGCEIGDELVGRVAAETQRKYLTPPDLKALPIRTGNSRPHERCERQGRPGSCLSCVGCQQTSYQRSDSPPTPSLRKGTPL